MQTLRHERFATDLRAQYEIERELGRGGAATVFLAHDLKHDRQVAIKALHQELSLALGTERFLAEIRLLARLHHPYILPLYDSGEAAGVLYYVMPYVQGESLRERMDRERHLPVADALRIARQVAEALGYAHAQNVVHRDITPENILLTSAHALVADFGVARAISRAADQRTTAAGVAVGTPAYMSPEQAAGDAQIDGRADIYSLGCVLYEMLAGGPPFTGPTPQAAIAARFSGPVPRVSAARPSVSARLEAAVTHALALLPADRFATAEEFASALPSADEPERPTRRRWWAFGGAAGVALLGAALGAWSAREGRSEARLDPALYAVVPFGHVGGGAARLMDGNQCEQLLYDAFSRWTDIRLVNGMQVSDAGQRAGAGGPASLGEALRVARAVGAGTLAWGEVREFQGRLFVRGALYDARDGGRLREHQVEVAPDLADAGARFAELADSLIAGGEPRATAAGAMGTRSVRAWRAYARGHAALRAWDLAAAADAFRDAVAADPDYAQAHLWLAQTASWRPGGRGEEWRAAAAHAAALRERLAPRDAALAAALAALTEERYPEACDAFRALVRRDSTDFAAWYGLGDCQASDELVLRDETSPSGWRFRASYAAAIDAYERALRVLPSVHLAFRGPALDGLMALLYTEGTSLRRGYALTPDTVWLAAYPSLLNDTLAFVPYPLARVVAADPATVPSTVADAVGRNRQALLRVARSWADAFPDGPDALEALAEAQESLGELGGADGRAPGALATVRRARAGAAAAQRVRLAGRETRLLVKRGEWAAARALADSTLGAASAPPPTDAELLAGLAALTGRARAAAELAVRSASEFRPVTSTLQPLAVPAPVLAPARALGAYAALGVFPESVLALRRAVEDGVRGYVEPRLQAETRAALLRRPMTLAFPALGARASDAVPAGGDYLMELQQALAAGRTGAVRARLRALADARGALRAGDLSFDVLHQEAWIALAAGDTASAVARLDASLNALPSFGAGLLRDDVAQPAGLVRAMALRAEVAARTGDAATAHRWAAAVLALWDGGDDAVHPVTSRMRALMAP